MKHWYQTAIVGTNDEGVHYTVSTQLFYIDDGRTMVNLADVFKNTGIGFATIQIRAFIAKHSIQMAKDRMTLPMAAADDVQAIMLEALAAGFGNDVKAEDVMGYVMHLKNVLKPNAMGAYLVERRKAAGEDAEPAPV